MEIAEFTLVLTVLVSLLATVIYQYNENKKIKTALSVTKNALDIYMDAANKAERINDTYFVTINKAASAIRFHANSDENLTQAAKQELLSMASMLTEINWNQKLLKTGHDNLCVNENER